MDFRQYDPAQSRAGEEVFQMDFCIGCYRFKSRYTLRHVAISELIMGGIIQWG
jgi:hypothetical protein